MKKKVVWVLKNMAVFLGLYLLGAVIATVFVTVVFLCMGYDFLQGEIPQGGWADLIPLYGAGAFAVLTVLYVKGIAKRKLSDIRLNLDKKELLQAAAGLVCGMAAVAVIILILAVAGVYRFAGYQGISPAMALGTLGAFIVQGMGEEMMCRGFLQNFLEERISRQAAIFFSALAFAAPHVPSFEGGILTILLSLCNLFLVSALFSLAMVRWNSLWVCAGLHAGWNYCLSYVFGLQVSGLETGNGALLFEAMPGHALLHGGSYGIEAGLAVTILMIVGNLAICLTGKKRAGSGE